MKRDLLEWNWLQLERQCVRASLNVYKDDAAADDDDDDERRTRRMKDGRDGEEETTKKMYISKRANK